MNTGTPEKRGVANVHCSSLFVVPQHTYGVRLTQFPNNEVLTGWSFSFWAFKILPFHSAKVIQRQCCRWERLFSSSCGLEDASLHLVMCCVCPWALVSWVLVVGTSVFGDLHLKPTAASSGQVLWAVSVSAGVGAVPVHDPAGSSGGSEGIPPCWGSSQNFSIAAMK